MSDSRDDFIIALRYSLLKKGAKQKFSLFFLIIFSITIITLDKLSIPPVNFVRSTINDLVYRITIIAAVPGNVIVYLGSKTKKHLNIYSENIALKEELDLLKKKNMKFLILKRKMKI